MVRLEQTIRDEPQEATIEISSREKVSPTAEKLAKTMQDSYKTVVNHPITFRERNVRFA